MKTLYSLPDQDIWSLVNTKNGPVLLTSPKVAYSINGLFIEYLLSSKRLDRCGYDFVEKLLSRKVYEKNKSDLTLFHAFYELGFIYQDSSQRKEDDLGVWLEFEVGDPINLPPSNTPSQINWSLPEFRKYKEAFDKGVNHLKNGDCYQFNLTFPFNGKFKEFNLFNFACKIFSNPDLTGRFASLTKIGEKIYFSNSPECLAEIYDQRDGTYLRSKPIKGTLATKNFKNKNAAWSELEKSKKDESELYMITDLLRNDLNRIGPYWVDVLEKKSPLFVNGLVHSYSCLEVKLDQKTTVGDIFRALFPGGSITGAPKKRVMDIIEKIECDKRGFYCGSTLLFGGGECQLSINIRSGHILLNKGEAKYHSGGGVTIKSTAESEFLEMLDKFHSFDTLLKRSGNKVLNDFKMLEV